ncbi:hypothetical protein GcC1_091009 [Golovinomyces cichoracearum]|uniref:Uncharacterized protein n=1 Tax=Golovinomyces cichoracearum TaxID=62708 RepID=A0A420IFB0_9PEZI|nr:hypothetical protein GcC1_091009 [Golovinomyces cichoracearum]
MGIRDISYWWPHSTTNFPVIANDVGIIQDQAGELIEPLESTPKLIPCEYQRHTIKPLKERTHSSLLTQAIKAVQDEGGIVESKTNSEHTSTRPQSIMSSFSLELTSDGGTTGQSRSGTPSPSQSQQQNNASHIRATNSTLMTKVYPANGTYLTGSKCQDQIKSPLDPKHPYPTTYQYHAADSATLKTEVRPNDQPPSQSNPVVFPGSEVVKDNTASKQPRRPTIKFACAGPQTVRLPPRAEQTDSSLSPGGLKSERSSLSCTNRLQSNPIEVPANFPTIMSHTQKPLSSMSNEGHGVPGSSQATRFHEFASEEMEVDDWLRQDLGMIVSKLTINDTMKKENEIRRLASEAEEEAELEKAEAEESMDDSDEETENDSEFLDFAYDSMDDGNETDNENGFADSDENDDQEIAFWTPNGGHQIFDSKILDFTEDTNNRTTSNSSIGSLSSLRGISIIQRRRFSSNLHRKTIDLPDSTDFVCGTLDEDRPLEEAYLSCLEARKQARHILTPQDIDPSFPTSDDDKEKDFNCTLAKTNGKQKNDCSRMSIESLTDDGKSGRCSRSRIPASHYSPKKLLHSPPPPKQRLRTPPPRKFVSASPNHLQSSNTSNGLPSSTSRPITFTSFGARSGLTHTKSLPRKPSPFCRRFCEPQSANSEDSNLKRRDQDSHVRGAIDIVKGLEQKRQRRNEKLYMKQHTNRKVKGAGEHKPLPGRGADFMREVGLVMANKAGAQNAYILSA